MKDWTKKTIVEEDEKLNKVRIAKNNTRVKIIIRKDPKDVVHKELYKIYYKTFIIIYGIDIVFGFLFFIDFII